MFLGSLIGLCGERVSANYTVPTDSLDGGGRPSASASYAHEGSLGSLGGASTATSSAYVVRHGYIGQSREVTGLSLMANPTNINEASTVSLKPSLVYDDGTSAVTDASTVVWRRVHGPVTLSPLGELSAGVVLQTVPARVRAEYQAYAATLDFWVLNSDPDNYGMYAADGISDDWQLQYFGLNNPFAAPDMDPDGDRQVNAFEYVAGLDPTQYASQFRLSIENVPASPDRKNITFGPRFPTRHYTVEVQVNQAAGTFEPLLGSTNLDVGSIRTVVDENATNAVRFYRVRISLPGP